MGFSGRDIRRSYSFVQVNRFIASRVVYFANSFSPVRVFTSNRLPDILKEVGLHNQSFTKVAGCFMHVL